MRLSLLICDKMLLASLGRDQREQRKALKGRKVFRAFSTPFGCVHYIGD